MHVRWSQLEVYLIMFDSFFQVTRTLVVHNVNLWVATSNFEDLVDIEERITDGCCLPVLIGSARIALLSNSYMTITYKFTLIDLCGKAPVRSLKLFLLILKGMMVAHSS